MSQSIQRFNYRFQIIAETKVGESIGIVGSAPELGGWDITRYVPLRTSGDRYPLWWTDTEINLQLDTSRPPAAQKIEYKYVHINADGIATWEAWGWNRWLPIVPPEADYPGLDPSKLEQTIVVDDGAFGYLQAHPFGYLENPSPTTTPEKSPDGLKIVVIGSSVALGHRAWMLEGWAERLGKALHQHYGHQLVNVSEVGANVGRTIDRFPTVVAPEKPDIVIIALSLGNEGFAHCRPQDRRVLQRRFESGLQQLLKMTRQLEALPMLAGTIDRNIRNCYKKPINAW
jgi:Starch binding domain